jgi:hypothetical protein
VIERPRWNLTLFKVHFGLLTLKGYTKGEHLLRFEAIVHNTRTLHTARMLKNFPAIVARLAAIIDRFTSMLDCVDVAFLPDGIHDHLPIPSQIGASRLGGVDINRPRARAALTAVLALAVAPDGFTVGDLAGKVRSLTGKNQDEFTVRHAAYDLRKLRAKQLVLKPGRTRRYQVPGEAARTIAALLTLRDQVVAPIVAGIRRPGPGRPPKSRTQIDRDYEASAPACAPCSTTWQSAPPPHRQQIVDHMPQVTRTSRNG